MRQWLYILLMLCLFLGGCIRDEIELCPPLQVRIGVKDKNYFNIDGAEHFGMETRKADDLPFKEYVSTLYYVLSDAATGEVVKEQTLFTVTSGDREIPVAFPQELPFGTYVLTVWGNMLSKRPLSDDASASDLHLYNAQGNDIYLQSDTLVYDEMSFEYLVELERVKGKLIIQAENLPDNINYSSKDITNVYAYVTNSFNYSKAVLVHTDTLWESRNDILTKTLLCPSTDIDASNLHIDFYSVGREATVDNGKNWIVPEDIRITMRRNELTILRYIYESGGEPLPPDEPDEPDEPDKPDEPDEPDNPDIPDVPDEPVEPDPGNSKFKVYVLINDNWEGLHSMEID